MRTTADAEFQHLFRRGTSSPCREGAALLRAFAKARPNDFSFLQSADLSDLSGASFAGIIEWDVFARHYIRCKLCHA